MGDEIGNTPLHTAAMLGNVKMYRCIAEVEKRLIGARNKDSDTHFFLVASHGHKHAFLCLHSLCGSREGYNYSKSNNGETILHSAIAGDYFDLAFQIIHHYEELVNSMNDRGLSPIHLLAAKPSAFRRGIFIDKLEVENSDNYKSLTQNQDGDQSICPANYETCYNLITLLLKGIIIVMDRATDCTFDNEGKPDADNPPEGANQHRRKAANGTQGKNNQKGEGDDDPISKVTNYFLPIIASALSQWSKAILVILGLGSNNIRKIWEKKPNNTWSIQVMNELLKRVSMYEYKNDGKKPLQPQSQPGDDSLDQETKPYTFDAVSEVTLAEDALHIPPTSNVSGANQHQQKAAEGPQDKNQTENKEGTLEMEKKESPILKALHDYMNYQKKNVVLLAMENRQPHVYQLLVKMNENKEEISEMEKIESPILIAAKNGITEIVEKILEKFPIALYDINYEKKNVVLLAVENRPTKCVSAVTKDDKHERKLRVPTSG
ncbi:hypothetical protein QYF36_023950 [Acer negundo]|nr:hypothetical protein QYF36_023950 [Acer negundo]